MGSRRTQRQLIKLGRRVQALRSELATIDEQLAHLADEAGDLTVRALVADSPQAAREAADSGRHADAMRRHRQHVVAEIGRLAARQDELLDRHGG